MKTLKPVDQETYERIGAAYAICSQYPEVFGDVTMRKFCSMFVDDIIDDEEDEKLARMKAYAETMYYMLTNLRYEFMNGGASDDEYIKQIIIEIGQVLSEIDLNGAAKNDE